MNKIKNWLLTIVFVAGAVADLGFDVLCEIGLTSKQIAIIRAVVVVGGAVALKIQPPSRVPGKIRNIAERVEKKQKSKT